MKWFISRSAVRTADLPRHLKAVLREPGETDRSDSLREGSGSVCLLASDLLTGDGGTLPSWIDADTRYLVVRDIPTPAVMRLPTLLRLHKPDQRLFLTDDPGSIRRWAIARYRRAPFEGIIDAYAFDGSVWVLLGDLTLRRFPARLVPPLRTLGGGELDDFEIDIDGSFLVWKDHDIHLGPSQLLQAVDPSERAAIEIERYRIENTAAALRHMREERELRQADIPGLSERQVSRLENGASRLTAEAAEKWAGALDMSLEGFLEEMGALLTAWERGGPLVGGTGRGPASTG